MADADNRELLRQLMDEALRENPSANLMELTQIVHDRLEKIAAKSTNSLKDSA
jgi:hypothetical protein